MPTALYPAVRNIGTNPPSGPHPISTTSAGEAGNQDRTNGHMAASHRSSEVIPPEPTPDRPPVGPHTPISPRATSFPTAGRQASLNCRPPRLPGAGLSPFGRHFVG